MKKIFSLLLVIPLLALVTSCGLNEKKQGFNSLEQIYKNNTIRIGYHKDDQPYEGIEVALANQIAKDLKVKLDLIVVPENEDKIQWVVDNKIDLELTSNTITKVRQERVAFSLPYLHVETAALVNKSSGIVDMADLQDKRLGVINFSPQEFWATDNFPKATLNKYPGIVECIEALRSKKVDAVLMDNIKAFEDAYQDESLEVPDKLGYIGNLDQIAASTQLGNDTLVNWVNNEFYSLARDDFFVKTFEKVTAQYIGTDSNFAQEFIPQNLRK
jgi:ABC-type amino acid transport substrate-binding protein